MADPTYRWVPEHDCTNGDLAIQLGVDLGMPPDEDQQSILNAIFAYRSETPAVPVCFEAGVIAPRQNIKTSTLELAALTDVFVFEEPLHIWTAHLFKTSQQTFKHMCELIAGNREYSKLCKKPRTANGDEAIVLKSGQEIQFHARSKGGGRGYTARKVTLDEGLFLVPTDLGALLPTMATVDSAQVRYGSSAGMAMSEVLRGVRDRGRAGGDPSLAYFEWCAEERPCEQESCSHRPGTDGCSLDDVGLWEQANPALHRRITVTMLGNFRRALPPEEFAREFLTWWEDPVIGDSGFPAESWALCADRKAAPADPVTLAVDVSPNHASAAIVACGGPVEVLEHRRGADWAVARIRDLVEAQDVSVVGLDPSGPAGALIPALTKPVAEGGAGLVVRDAANPDGKLVLLDGRESTLACAGFLADVVDRELVHRDESSLNDAVDGAGRRQSGDAWKWSRKDSTVDITPLVAATVARYLWKTEHGDGVVVLEGSLMA